ncbi:MAG TPA: hypothetical protein VMF61_00575 [Candidatus Acidoferrales bacterium]|nr:hypothetical protein [Candidatus Acidoferrales bacterium]
MRKAIAAAALFAAVLPLWTAAGTQPISDAAAVALVRAAHQLDIDPTVPPEGAFDRTRHPYVRVGGVPEGGSVGGYLDAAYAREGRLLDGTLALAIPLDSGGSGGVFTQLIFAGPDANRLAYAGHLDSGGHLGVDVAGGVIVARYPNYGPNDPNCCPSRFDVETYTIAGGKLRRIGSKTVPSASHPPQRRRGSPI